MANQLLQVQTAQTEKKDRQIRVLNEHFSQIQKDLARERVLYQNNDIVSYPSEISDPVSLTDKQDSKLGERQVLHSAEAVPIRHKQIDLQADEREESVRLQYGAPDEHRQLPDHRGGSTPADHPCALRPGSEQRPRIRSSQLRQADHQRLSKRHVYPESGLHLNQQPRGCQFVQPDVHQGAAALELQQPASAQPMADARLPVREHPAADSHATSRLALQAQAGEEQLVVAVAEGEQLEPHPEQDVRARQPQFQT